VGSVNAEHQGEGQKRLEIEQSVLERIPTWPWQPETVRPMVTALALPMVLWVTQYALQYLLGL
jgi:hypothetical protein